MPPGTLLLPAGGLAAGRYPLPNALPLRPPSPCPDVGFVCCCALRFWLILRYPPLLRVPPSVRSALDACRRLPPTFRLTSAATLPCLTLAALTLPDGTPPCPAVAGRRLYLARHTLPGARCLAMLLPLLPTLVADTPFVDCRVPAAMPFPATGTGLVVVLTAPRWLPCQVHCCRRTAAFMPAATPCIPCALLTAAVPSRWLRSP